MNLENITKSIESLAPLSDAILAIQKLFSAGQDKLDINELIRLIESDVLLSVNILKMANSPLYGFSNKIASVGQSVTLFGTMQVYGFIMSYVVNENIEANTKFYGLSNARFNDVCTMQSALLLQWYSKIDLEYARFLAPLALIMETGKLVLSSEIATSNYEKQIQESYKLSKNIHLFEKEQFGISSYEVSSKVFKHWHLERMYIKILEGLDKDVESEVLQKYVKIINVVITAVNVKTMLSKNSVLEACSLVQKMGFDPNVFAQTALKVKKAYVNGA